MLWKMSVDSWIQLNRSIRCQPAGWARCGLFLLILGGLPLMWAEETDFQGVVKPILARNCFECHGPDAEARKASLRLDDPESAMASRDGVQAIVPGDAMASAVFQRIITQDTEDRMPPSGSHKALSQEEIDRIRTWIDSGAEYAEHWAFLAPERSELPLVSDPSWVINAIDRFVLNRMEREGLEPSEEANRYALIRRLSLDLLGMVPLVDDVDRFVQDQKPGAYERLVDRLLASPRYGERWARQWLDLARYSDTNGYEKDRERSIWPYRDWVIDALNQDLRFDQFSIEQLAGDMLPEATASQRIATGFHRNTMLNEEGGIDPLEYRFYAMVDRVATTGAVWMGLTTGCAQCHSHKYDPISHVDYYSFMALMNNADEPDLLLRDPGTEKRREEGGRALLQATLGLRDRYPLPEGVAQTLEARHKAYDDAYARYREALRERFVAWRPLNPSKWETNLGRMEVLEDRSVFVTGDATKRDVYRLTFLLEEQDEPVRAIRLEALPDDRLPARGPGRAFYEGRKGDFFLSELTLRVGGEARSFASGSRSYGKISVGSGNGEAKNVFDGEGSTGWSTSGREGEGHYLVLNLEKPIQGAAAFEVELLFERHFVASLGRFRISVASQKGQAVDLNPRWETAFGRDHDDWTREEDEAVQRAFIRSVSGLEEARKSLNAIRGGIPKFKTTLVMRERAPDHPRRTHRHHRGEYLSPREGVEPGLPSVFLNGDRGPTDRLELARWLASPENPLVGRVTVNRAWRSFFGTGLLETSGDFGTQSNQPSHPRLLDWLAVEFMESGWSLKRLHRLIVMSRTYRQSSMIDVERLERDPRNRLLTRGPRHRLEGEMVRDSMLMASGLISNPMGGPSVRPPQPVAVTALAYGGAGWRSNEGEARYRRSLYTFSKRTAPFAAYAVFDGPSGENCTPRRNRSNTPLQALTLMNDPMYVELSQVMAKVVVARHAADRDRVSALFRRVVTRPPDPEETTWLMDYQRSQQARLGTGELDPESLLGGGEGGAELASWIMVARAIMNLDEAINK